MVKQNFIFDYTASDSLFTHSPGRFFASNELKALLAFVVLNYDVKLEKDGVRPPDEYFGNSIIPNRTAKVLFRKRAGNCMRPSNWDV